MTTEQDDELDAGTDDEQTAAGPPAGDEPDAGPADDEQDAGPAGDEPDDDEQDDDEQDGDTFPRRYVERLRARSAGYRARAKTAEERTADLERSLFTERVRALDVLADPADLPFSAELLEDPDALRAEVDALVAKSPHYRRRGTTSGTGAHEPGTPPAEGVSLLGLMRGGA